MSISDAVNSNRTMRIIQDAKKNGTKGSYSSYECYKARIYNLGLPYTDTENALRELARVLKV